MKLFFITFVFFIASCSSWSTVPTDQKNACNIIKDKRSWYRALQRTEKKWNVSKGTQLSFILTESNFRPRAKTQRKYIFGFIPSGRLSSAFGYAQVIDLVFKHNQLRLRHRGIFLKTLHRLAHNLIYRI